MVFNTLETVENGDGYITVTYKGKQIWKEIHGYEYYGRFIEMGQILKEKYGDRMFDLVPASAAMYGDAMSSPELV